MHRNKLHHLLVASFILWSGLACTDEASKTNNVNNTNNTNNVNNANNANNTNNTNNVNNVNNTNNTNNTNNANDICKGQDPAPEVTWSAAEERGITLDDEVITAHATVRVDGHTVTISEAGVYRIRGAMSDGRIVVSAGSTARVVLILDDATWTSSTHAALEVTNAAFTLIHLPEGTTSELTDGVTRPEGGANATIHVASDLAFTGAGTLKVHGRYNDGIRSMAGLSLREVNLVVTAADDGVVGEDCIVVHGGDHQVQTVSGDAFKAENSLDTSLGFLHLLGGAFHLDAASDGFQGEFTVLIEGGEYHIICAGGAVGVLNENLSSKGIKAGLDVIILGGSFVIDSADDGLHSNRDITIEGGDFTIATLDDAVHADRNLVIRDGVFDITKCYEGLEGSAVTIDGGEIHILSSDDAINGAGDYSPRSLAIHGGLIVINSTGDGLDVNGSMEMTAGTVIVYGPTRDDNGALDYDATFRMTGGLLIAAGSSRMAQAPGTTSTQNAVLWGFNQAVAANTLIHLRTATGDPLLTFRSPKQVASVLFSSPELEFGAHEIYTGGSATGTPVDGVFPADAYTPGTLFRSFTISSVITKVNIQTGPPSRPW